MKVVTLLYQMDVNCPFSIKGDKQQNRLEFGYQASPPDSESNKIIGRIRTMLKMRKLLDYERRNAAQGVNTATSRGSLMAPWAAASEIAPLRSEPSLDSASHLRQLPFAAALRFRTPCVLFGFHVTT